jgi:hypothetical protein
MKDAAYSHVMKIKGTDFCIIGQRTPVEGRGGGQFANHSKTLCNSVMKVTKVKRDSEHDWVYYGPLHFRPIYKVEMTPIVVVVAARDIKPQEEIFWSYPHNSVARLGLHDAPSPRPEVYEVSDVENDVNQN